MDANREEGVFYSEMAQLVMQNEKLRCKLKKVQQRRDHYARLYYRSVSDADETKWELAIARGRIRELKAQIAIAQEQQSSVNPAPHQVPPAPIPGPTTNNGRGRRSDSSTTTPDSGTSLSPGIEPVHPPPFVHRTRSLPGSVRHAAMDPAALQAASHKEAWSAEEPTTQPHPPPRERQLLIQRSPPPRERQLLSQRSPPPRERHLLSQRSPPPRERHLLSQRSPPPRERHLLSQRSPPPRERHLLSQRSPPPRERHLLSQRSVEDDARPHTHHHTHHTHHHSHQDAQPSNTRKNLPKPPQEAFASPSSARRHPIFPFEPAFSLSQGDNTPFIASPFLNSHRKLPPHLPQSQSYHPQSFALSQDAYVTSPPTFRKPAFDRPVGLSQASGPPQTVPQNYSRRPPQFKKTSLSQDDILSVPDSSYISAFKKPLPRKIPRPSRLLHSHSHPMHSSHPPPPQDHSQPSPASLQHPSAPLPPHPFHHSRLHCDSSSISSCDPGTQSPGSFSVGSGTTCIGLAPHNSRRGSRGALEERYEALTGVQMLDLLTAINDPDCTIRKLEVSNSHLGEPEAMKLFCKDLLRNKSIVELSLPNNGIGCDSLRILLDCVEHCDNIKELMLRNNLIGKECANIIKSFLTKTSLDSLVLTGNEIEQYGHLLNGGLPNDFTMEYDTTDGSEDSGLVVTEGETFGGTTDPPLHGFKYLHL